MTKKLQLDFDQQINTNVFQDRMRYVCSTNVLCRLDPLVSECADIIRPALIVVLDDAVV